jgi:hypothetical protein
MSDTKKTVWLLPGEPREGPHRWDTLNGCVYSLLMLDTGCRLKHAGGTFESLIQAHLARVEADPKKIRWSWGNCGIVCLTADQAGAMMTEAFADHPTVEYRGFVQ